MRDLASRILSRKTSAHDKAARKNDPNKPKWSTGRVLKYAFLPDLGSRISQIGKRLGGFAYFLAQIFYSCRLIPAGHPVLNTANIGYFGFTDVISVAAGNLQIRKENTDQIVMFAGVILSMVLLVANGLAIAAYTVLDFGTAMAATPLTGNLATGGAANGSLNLATGGAATAGSMFAAPHPESDLALQFLDLVFGSTSVPFFATSPGAHNTALGNSAIKEALYHMLSIYSSAMMVIAVIIILYYAFVVVGESAMTGQPFGKRFNTFWAPIRLVVGLGLLVPIAGGLNSAQYITLYAAKLGSGLASYGWSQFVQQLSNTQLISNATPKPNIAGLVQNIVRFETCAQVISSYHYFGNDVTVVSSEIKGIHGQPSGTVFRWDKKKDADDDKFTTPAVCGEIFIPNMAQGITSINGANTTSVADLSLLGSSEIQNAMKSTHDTYVKMVEKIVNDLKAPIASAVQVTNEADGNPKDFPSSPEYDALAATNAVIVKDANEAAQKAINDFAEKYKNKFQSQVKDRISSFDQKGWMGAGMFYTQIADLNGGLLNSVHSMFPRSTGDIIALPSEEQMKQEDGWFGSGKADGAEVDNETVRAISRALSVVPGAFAGGDSEATAKSRSYRQDFFTLFIVDLFGGEYIQNFREADQSNPLANLVALGNGMFNKAFDFIPWILGAVMASGLLGIVASVAGAAATVLTGGLAAPIAGVAIGATVLGAIIKPIAGILISIALFGAAVGLFLYYVVPLLPFVFFFFSITAWILEVIEAMVGLPLWALAHIRIDGDGLGQATQTGYTIIFGIIIRPFVILFAFIVGIILYSAAMYMVKEMFTGYAGLIGTGESDALSYMVFSIMYAVIAFTLGMLCFKQCDQMTNQIMRWFGGSDPRYNDGQIRPEQTLQQVALGAGVIMNQMGQNMSGAVNSIGEGIGSGVGKKQEIGKGRQTQKTGLQSSLGGAIEGERNGMSPDDLRKVYGGTPDELRAQVDKFKI